MSPTLPTPAGQHRRRHPGPLRPWWSGLLIAMAAVVVLAGSIPVARAADPGLTCDSEAPAPDDTLACEAGGLEAGEPYYWIAEFADGQELTGDGDVDSNGDASFDLTVPDAPGDFTVDLTSDGEMDGTAVYTFTGTVTDPGEDDDEEEDTEEDDTEDTTPTTSAFDDTTTTTALADTTTTTAAEVLSAVAEPVDQVAALPAGGVATGIGPAGGSSTATLVLVVLGLGVVLAIVGVSVRRAGRHSR